MKRCLFLIFAILSVGVIRAQVSNPINTDRPDQSDGTYVLPKNNFQIEEGVLLQENNFQNNMMFRYGVTKSTEIRILSDFCKTYELKGFIPLGISFKQRLIQDNKLIPAITLVGYMRVGQLASTDFVASENPVDLKLAFQNDLTQKISLSYNVGTSLSLNHLNYTINWGYSPTDRIAMFGEYYSDILKEESPSNNLDFGVLYLITEKLQVDVAFGSSIQLLQEDDYLTAGMSYRF